MKIPNINCKHYSDFGECFHPDKKNVYWFFRPQCILIGRTSLRHCTLQEQYERPNAPPPPPRKPVA
jgi:hypothetical protein